jgi:hypothetical protein
LFQSRRGTIWQNRWKQDKPTWIKTVTQRGFSYMNRLRRSVWHCSRC